MTVLQGGVALLPVDPEETPVIGVEHEYVVRRHGAVVDFRGLVGDLRLGRPGLDPSDPHARRCDWGGAVTADGPEAEVVTPPVVIAPGSTAEVELQARYGSRQLSDALGPELQMDGFSTHLNIYVTPGRELRVARRLVRHFGPALMLTLDRSHSPGILVRPRPGRVEIGGEYLAGESLRAALVLGVGAVAACTSGRRLPVCPSARPERAVERYGWYLDRRCFGPDLYEEGRHATLRRTLWRPVTAQTALHDAWQVSRPWAQARFDPTEISLVDDLVEGHRPLPLEQPVSALAETQGAQEAPESPWGKVLHRRCRPGFEVTISITTWDVVVFALTSGRRQACLAVKRRHLATTLARLDAGELDADLLTFLRGPASGRTLVSAEQVDGPTVFDQVADPSGLVGRERNARTGKLEGPGGGGGDRPGKDSNSGSARGPAPAASDSRGSRGLAGTRRRRGLLATGAAGVLLLVVGAVAVAVSSGPDDKRTSTLPVAPPSSSRSDPSATAAPVSPTAAPAQGELAGIWQGPSGRVRISGSDAAYEQVNISLTFPKCRGQFTALDPAAKFSGSGPSFSGQIVVLNTSTCKKLTDYPLKVVRTGPNTIEETGLTGTQPYRRIG